LRWLRESSGGVKCARIAVVIAVGLVAASFVTTPADGQTRRRAARRVAASRVGPEVGIHAGYNFDIDHALIGAQASFPITRDVELYPSFDYFTGQSAAKWAVNVDLKVRPPARYQFWYGGAGLNLLHAATTTSHLGLFAGFAGRPGPFRPYAEARLIVGNGSAFQLAGGLSFPLR
jgi:hypothetical protein